MVSRAQSPDLNTTESLCSVLDTRVKNSPPPQTSQKQVEDVQKEWYKIPLEIVQNLYESITRGTAAVLRPEVVLSHINKDMCSVSIILLNPCIFLTPHKYYQFLYTHEEC
jgi:hypothetical protein